MALSRWVQAKPRVPVMAGAAVLEHSAHSVIVEEEKTAAPTPLSVAATIYVHIRHARDGRYEMVCRNLKSRRPARSSLTYRASRCRPWLEEVRALGAAARDARVALLASQAHR